MLAAGLLSVALTISATGAVLADTGREAPGSVEPSTLPLLDLEQLVGDTVDDLGESLTGGVYIGDDGSIVVTVTTSETDPPVVPPGAKIKTVDHSLQQLQDIQAELDRYAKRHGAGKVQTWYVDMPANEVVVTAPVDASDERTRAFLHHARSIGPEVTIRRADVSVRPARSNLYNSTTIHLTNSQVCSTGFNAVDAQGRQILITAGHCLMGFPAAYHGRFVGAATKYRYPGGDFGAVRTDTSAWRPRAAVNMYNGRARVVWGSARPPVGARICKSSATSGWSCGTVQAYDQTVNYGNGNLVYGLVRFSACVEPGDSGGAVMYGSYAVGLISGAQFHQSSTGADVCGQRLGQPSVSFYQPIRPALRALNARLLTYPRSRN